MSNHTRYLLILCIAAVSGAFLLQILWIRNYYDINKASFQKEVNLALEDAVKKELIVRCDTIEDLVVKQLLDTNAYIVKNRYALKQHAYMVTIMDKQHPADSSSFHTDSLMRPLLPGDEGYRLKVAKYFAKSIRGSELENHFVFYHTQKLGNYVNKMAHRYDFDTTRLRPIFKKFLAEREITTPFTFYTRAKDSTFNTSTFQADLKKQYAVISKAFITYKQDKNQHYVRALFISPFAYIIHKMWLLFAGSALLIVVIAASMFHLFRSLLTEKKLSAIKNDFISNITHELKTPIATISAAVEAMSDFDILEDRKKTNRYLSHTKNELTRLSSLVDKVLNISLYEKKGFTIKPEQLNLDTVIPQLLRQHKAVSHKAVSFSYVNDTPVKSLVADRMYFEHALNNLIDNAIKYSGAAVDIKVKCTIQQSFLAIAVRDNGIGISGHNAQLIFEKFYRVPTGNQHQVKGHGLGLSYVKSIIERHNGWYKLESEPGRGSTFILGWPV